MNVKYCLPIIRTALSDVSALIESEKERYDLFEVWLDYLEDTEPQAVEALAKTLSTRGIFLFRRQNLEPIRMSAEKREAAANAIAGTGALLDVDVLSQPEDAELAASDILAREGKDWRVTRADVTGDPLAPHEVALLDAVLGGERESGGDGGGRKQTTTQHGYSPS